MKFLIYALSSNDETVDHLETLFETRSLTDELLYNELHLKLDQLGKKLNNFIQAVERSHNEFSGYPSSIQHPASSIQHPASSIQYPLSSIQYQVSIR